MSERMIKYKRALKTLARCSPGTARRLIQQGEDDFILAILDAVWTTLDGRVSLFPAQLDKIRSMQSVLRLFASQGRSVKERKRVLLKKQNGIRAIQTVFKAIKNQF